MDELHAAIAAHLRRQRRQVAEDQQRDNRILAIWREWGAVPRCRHCGKAIAEDDDMWAVEDLRRARACADHYAPF